MSVQIKALNIDNSRSKSHTWLHIANNILTTLERLGIEGYERIEGYEPIENTQKSKPHWYRKYYDQIK